ncbi:hypothetical protein AAID91_04895 [Campylobacter coli]
MNEGIEIHFLKEIQNHDDKKRKAMKQIPKILQNLMSGMIGDQEVVLSTTDMLTEV